MEYVPVQYVIWSTYQYMTYWSIHIPVIGLRLIREYIIRANDLHSFPRSELETNQNGGNSSRILKTAFF